MLLAAAALGISQLTKYSCLLLYPSLFIASAVARFADISERPGRREAVFAFVRDWVIIIGVSLFVINAGFLFDQPFRLWKDAAFESGVLKKIQAILSVGGVVPTFLPKSYLDGLDMVLAHERAGAAESGF